MKHIIIILIALMAVPQGTLQAQGREKKVKITGYVIDGAGNPVTDVIILADGRSINATVNRKGIFRVKADPSTNTLSVYSVPLGVIEKEFTVTDTISFIFEGILPDMPQNPNSAEEVVDIGYGNSSKDDITTSVSKLDINDKKRAQYQTIYDMIEGTVPGVEVIGRRIRIRGVGSLNLTTDPLFIVNGMEAADISNIPPNDVESISILKGASASIYGSKGGNGVILIKLK
ncbi:MAG: TonB-dependent receptor plug domain-containing protein [Bacteroidales bacterium]|nr:TonB-dependent receptor plug domain-containing protein [Bacteroidales bacterium]